MNLIKQEINPWVEVIARVGFAAKGLLYIIMGYLSFEIVIGIGGQTAGMKEVLTTIHQQSGPFGDIILILLAAGLAGHAYWRFIQSVFNADNKKIDFKNLLDRVGYFTSVILYGGLAYFSLKIMGGSGGSGSSTEGITALVLSKPFGRWLIIIAGLAIGGSGLFQIYFGTFSKFEFKYKLGEMSNFEEKLTRYISMVGLTARGIVFILISIFLIQAAIEYNPQKAAGIGKALSKALYEPYGHWLLGAAAVGLAAYGGYCIILAKFRKIPINQP